ncbi:MAG: hypothetical protein ACRDXX_11910 [Stackebrandtia sp.]
MLADSAQIARTLASGCRPAVVQVAWSPEAWVAPAAVDPVGTPLLLTSDSGQLNRALSTGNGLDTAVALSFADEAPVPGAPTYGSAYISGWAERVPAGEVRQAAVAFCDSYPVVELLDVGDGFGLWRLDVAEVRLADGPDLVDVPVEEYAAAEPDAWYSLEQELLLDLYDHHPEVLERIASHVRARDADVRWVTPVRVDSSGLTVMTRRAGDERDELLAIRLRSDHGDLPGMLHELSCCRCLHAAEIEPVAQERKAAG